MNKIESDYTNNLGNTKYISKPDKDGFINKIFKTRKQMLPIEEQRKLLEMKKKYFGKYIPETILIEISDKDYIIRQKFIEGKTLSQIDISTLSTNTLEQLIDLIKNYLKYYREQGGYLDLTGYQLYEGNPNFIMRKIKNFLKINQNFLASTNIMIGTDGNVYIVDICESADTRIEGKIKNFCAKPFIKRTISKLEEILQQKINYNKNINNELYETLSK